VARAIGILEGAEVEARLMGLLDLLVQRVQAVRGAQRSGPRRRALR
jgi:hypothetical protein